MHQSLADKALSRKVLGRFGIGFTLAFTLLVFIFVLLIFAAHALVAFAFLAFAQHREIHGYNITSGRTHLCSAKVKQQRPDLRIALQDV